MSFLFDVEGNENTLFEVFKIPKTKDIVFEKFNEMISCFQFCVGVGLLKDVDDIFFAFENDFKDSLKKRMNLL